MGVLAGQKAIVTGANSGIGRATALALAQAGADVVVSYLAGEAEAEEVVRAINDLGTGARAVAVRADVTREADVRALFDRALGAFGTLDILVNNAGVQAGAPFEQMTLADWNHVIDVNLTGQFLCAREAVRVFKRQGVRPAVARAAGKILFISSVHDVIPWGGHVNYAASKGGVMMLMKSIAQEVARHHIRVNSISPGAIATGLTAAALKDRRVAEKVLGLIPARRIGEVEEVARAAVWLASDESDYMTGTTLYLDGGMTLYPGFAVGQ
ncbi:MAG TPA: glucose 1-dehydrogenase [Polyangia bacterium]